ncbi:MAG: NAD+ synthase [Phycisphaeraceae bacterium]
MKIAMAQINPTVGDIAGNARLIRQAIERAAEQGANLVMFPELAVIGYPPKDLLLKPAVVEEAVEAVAELARDCTEVAAIIGYPSPSGHERRGRSLYNAAAFCHQGRILHRHVKSLLPTYDVFDEHRYFEPGPRVDLTEFGGLKLGISICEDLWNEVGLFERQLYHDNPVDELAAAGAQLFLNCSASPFTLGKHAFRRKLFAHIARRHKLPLFYCNQVGGNDELIFDGSSCAFDAQGNLIAQAKSFEEDLIVVECPMPNVQSPVGPNTTPGGGADETAVAPDLGHSHASDMPDLYHALVLGLRDYCRKCGFKSIVLGLSGGIDSALTAALCVGALGKEKVRGVALPSRYSSPHSLKDARDAAENLGIAFTVISIAPMHEAFERELAPHFEGRPPDTTEENIQARVRGVTLMALSNKLGALLVTTGNKSEIAVGYCTLYGDMAGGLAVLSDVPKTLVWKLSLWINNDEASPLRRQYGGPVIPHHSIVKPPSAELRPNQTDQDSLPPYHVLDDIIERYVERDQSARMIVEHTDIPVPVVLKVVRMIDLNEYKRKQSAPGLKVTGRAFGFGRRMPIAQGYDSSRSLGSATVRKD